VSPGLAFLLATVNFHTSGKIEKCLAATIASTIDLVIMSGLAYLYLTKYLGDGMMGLQYFVIYAFGSGLLSLLVYYMSLSTFATLKAAGPSSRLNILPIIIPTAVLCVFVVIASIAQHKETLMYIADRSANTTQLESLFKRAAANNDQRLYQSLVSNYRLPASVIQRMFPTASQAVRTSIAQHHNTPETVLRQLVVVEDPLNDFAYRELERRRKASEKR